MGLAWYVTLNKPLKDPDPATSISGKALAHNDEPLESLAKSLNVRPLTDFVSVSADDVDDILGDDAPDVEIEESWFEPADGLRTVRALSQDLRKATKLDQPDHVAKDLAALERILMAAEEKKAKFHLSVDL